MAKQIDPRIVMGKILGRCPRCGGMFSGDFNTQPMGNSAKVSVELFCVNARCGHFGKYFYQWPDDMPRVTLRHWSNGFALGPRKLKKVKKKNPDNVLKGQLSFDMPKGAR